MYRKVFWWHSRYVLKALPCRQTCENSWATDTYVCVGPLICPWAGERDKFMAPLVDHKAANCKGRKQTKKDCSESFRKKEGKKWRQLEDRRRTEWVTQIKNSTSLLSDMWTDSRDRLRSGHTEKSWDKLMSGLGSSPCVQMATPVCLLLLNKTMSSLHWHDRSWSRHHTHVCMEHNQIQTNTSPHLHNEWIHSEQIQA